MVLLYIVNVFLSIKLDIIGANLLNLTSTFDEDVLINTILRAKFIFLETIKIKKLKIIFSIFFVSFKVYSPYPSFFFWWVTGSSNEGFLGEKARMAEQEYPPARSDLDRPGFSQYNTTTFLRSHAKSSDQLANGVRVAFGR